MSFGSCKNDLMQTCWRGLLFHQRCMCLLERREVTYAIDRTSVFTIDLLPRCAKLTRPARGAYSSPPPWRIIWITEKRVALATGNFQYLFYINLTCPWKVVTKSDKQLRKSPICYVMSCHFRTWNCKLLTAAVPRDFLVFDEWATIRPDKISKDLWTTHLDILC